MEKVFAGTKDASIIGKALAASASYEKYRSALDVIRASTAVGPKTKEALGKEIDGKVKSLPGVVILSYCFSSGLTVEVNGIDHDYADIKDKLKGAITPDDVSRAKDGDSVFIVAENGEVF